MGEVLEHLGAGVAWEDGGVAVDATHLSSVEAPYELVRRMRASIAVLGPLLARTGEARVAMPGGDNIGSRPIDLHLDGLRRMGARIDAEHGFLVATTDGLSAASITLDYPSVGATENLMMAAVTADGVSVIDNAAREPEIADLAAFLVAMGAGIHGAGSATIEVEGVETLRAAEHTAICDRIEAGTWAAAAVATRGDIVLGRRASRAPRAPPREARGGRRRDPADRRRAPGPPAGTRAGGRLRDAAVSGHRDGLPADPPRDAVHGERDEHRHGERLRGPVHLRRRAPADGGGHPDRGTPRGDPRCRAAVRRARAGAGHPGGRRDGDRRAHRRRRDARSRTSSTSTGDTRTSRRSSRDSAPRSGATPSSSASREAGPRLRCSSASSWRRRPRLAQDQRRHRSGRDRPRSLDAGAPRGPDSCDP